MSEPTGTSDGGAASTAPLTREEVFSQMEATFNDPNHPQHRAALSGLPSFEAWSESLYKRIPNMGGVIEIDKPIIGNNGVAKIIGVDVVEGSEADAARLREGVASAVEARGIDLKAVHAESERLFAGSEGAAVLDLLDERTLTGLAPEATREAHVHMAQYIADLAALRSSAGATTDAEGVAPEAFQARYRAALEERGIDVRTLDATIDNLFAGRADLYAAFIKRLDAFPPGARLAAYVRSAEAMMMFSRLQQYVA